jgi:hypothetical protein
MVSRRSAIEQVARPGKYFVEHGGCEPTGLRVVAAAVVRIEQNARSREGMAGAVGKSRQRRLHAGGLQHRRMGDSAERDDDGRCRQRSEFPDQVGVALPHFGRQWLVRGRQAFDRVRDAAVEELQSVAGRDGFRAARESMRVQRAVQQDARVIPGEWTPRAVGAMQAGRQADDQQAMWPASERRDGPTVVVRMPTDDLVEERRQPGAAPAVRIERRGALAPSGCQRTLNWASSVEPCMAVIDDVPAVTVCATSSK